MRNLPSGENVGPRSPNSSFVMFVISLVSRLTVKMSPIAPRRAANATVRPSGEMLGDSGSSSEFNSMRCSTFLVRTFCRISDLDFSVRTKYASRSPLGLQDNQGTVLNCDGYGMYSNPISLSKPDVRLRTIDPSLADTRSRSSSPSFRLPVTIASKSPDGASSTDSTFENGPFS